MELRVLSLSLSLLLVHVSHHHARVPVTNMSLKIATFFCQQKEAFLSDTVQFAEKFAPEKYIFREKIRQTDTQTDISF